MRWVKDQKVEANLRRLGIDFDCEKIEIASVDLEEGLRRQARLIGKLNDDYVLQLGIAMQSESAAFPMTILQRPPRGKLWPWSGNHRLAAFTLTFPNETVIEAYTVKLADPVMLDVLPRIVNAWESGLGFSREERILNAKWLIEHHSMPTQEAADLLGIKPEWIITTRRAEEVRSKVLSLGPKVQTLPKSLLISLSPLSDNSNVLKAIVRLLLDEKMKGRDAEQLIRDVRSRNTENQQISEIARWEKLMADRKEAASPRKSANNKPAKVLSTPLVRQNFLSKLISIAKILERCDTIEKLQCSDPASKETLLREWRRIEKVMTKIVQGV